MGAIERISDQKCMVKLNLQLFWFLAKKKSRSSFNMPPVVRGRFLGDLMGFGDDQELIALGLCSVWLQLGFLRQFQKRWAAVTAKLKLSR